MSISSSNNAFMNEMQLEVWFHLIVGMIFIEHPKVILQKLKKMFTDGKYQ